MYKIIGSDSKEYGPVSSDKIREWLRQGRVNDQTKVKADGAADWQSLGSVAEFADAFSASPKVPGAAMSGDAQPSKLATWSLVLGIVGFLTFGITAIVGLILGIIASGKISSSNGRLTGKGTATAGIVTSAVAMLFVPVIAAALLLPALAQAKNKAQQIRCMNNLKQLALGVRMYSTDNKDTFPSASSWCEALTPYVSPGQSPSGSSYNVFACPMTSDQRCSYAYNKKLSGVDESKVDPQTVMIFESDAGWNAAGGAEIAKLHHRSVVNVAFADGHVEAVPFARLPTLQWNPAPGSSLK